MGFRRLQGDLGGQGRAFDGGAGNRRQPDGVEMLDGGKELRAGGFRQLPDAFAVEPDLHTLPGGAGAGGEFVEGDE